MKRFVNTNFDFDRLKTALTNSKIASKNNALYQTIYQLIDKVKDVHNNSQSQIDEIISSSSGGGGGGGNAGIPSDTVSTLDGTNDPGISTEYSRGDHKHDGPPASYYENGGGQEINVAGLSGLLADNQNVNVNAAGALDGNGVTALGVRVDGITIQINGSNNLEVISSLDYVLMSDGATPIPNPVDDGFGNFIYIEYAA